MSQFYSFVKVHKIQEFIIYFSLIPKEQAMAETKGNKFKIPPVCLSFVDIMR